MCENRVLLTATNEVPTDLADDAQMNYIDPYQSEIDQAIASSAVDTSTYIGAPDLDAATTESSVSDYFAPFADAFASGSEQAASAQNEATSDATEQTDSASESETASTAADPSDTEQNNAATDETFSVFSGDADVAGYASGMLGDSAPGMTGMGPDGSSPDDSSSGESDTVSGETNEDPSSDDGTGDGSNTNDNEEGSSGQTDGEQDSNGDNTDVTSDPDFTSQWTPLQFPEHVVFEETTLPNADSELDWTTIQPQGTDSFSNTFTSDASADPFAADNSDDPLANAVADLGASVTTSQTYTSPTEWQVTESYTNRFDTSATISSQADGDSTGEDQDSTTEDTDTGDLNRTGTETLTVTIIDGVSRTVSYVITDTITYESGTFPDEDEDTTDEEKWSIPDEWVTASKTSVVPTETDESEDDSENADDSSDGSSGFDTWDSGTTLDETDEDQEPVGLSDSANDGSRYKATSSSGFTITETVTTLPDGTPAMTYSVMIHMSSSVTSMVQGQFDLGFGLGTISENQNDGNGFKVTANANWLFFSSASISTSFNASATVPTGSGLSGLLNTSISGSFGFDVSVMAGGAVGGELGFQYQTSSGDASDGSDSYESFGIGGSANATGFMDFSLGVNLPFGAAPETTNEDGDEVTQHSFDVADESDDEFKVQLSTTANGSGTVGGFINYGSKSPNVVGNGYQSAQSSSYSMESKTSSGTELAVHLGTENTAFLIGTSGSYSYTEDSNSFQMEAWDVGSNGLPYSTSDTVTTKLKEEHDHKFRLSVGMNDEESSSDSAASDSNVNEGGATFDYTRNHTHILDITTGTGTYVERTTIEGAIGDKAPADQPQADGDNTSDDDESGDQEEEDTGAGGLVKNKTLTGSGMFGDHVTVLVDNEQLPWGSDPDGPGKTKEQILADYRAHREQQLRLEALLAITDDPEMQQLLRDQIAMQDDILAEIRAAASTAGITPGQLTVIDDDAEDAVTANPPEALEEWDGGEWVIDNFIGGGIIGGLQGGAAAIDGAIPIWDPLEGLAYDGDDTTLQWSQLFGGVARNSLLGAWGTSVWLARGGGQFSAILTSGTSRIGSLPLPTANAHSG